MIRLVTSLCACLMALAPLTAVAQPRLDVLRALLSTEESLAVEARARYLAEREQESEAQALTAAALASLDAAFQGAADGVFDTPLAELERLQIEVDAASVAASYATRKAEEARRLLFESARRVDALERQVRGILVGGGALDPITGQWAVLIASPAEEATFELQLNGTLVVGTFAFEDGRSGSLRGTYAGGRLDLERLDADGGLAGRYLGTVDTESGRASGLWNPSELSDGGPGFTGWSAERAIPDPSDDPEIANQETSDDS